MLYNFLKIAWRNIKRHKLFSFINIFSLTLSLTICLAVMMFIKNQLDFDDFHPYPDRTYRIITEASGFPNTWATSPLPLGKYLVKNYPSIESSVHFYSLFGKATAAEKKLDVSGLYSDPTFFDIFGFKLKFGNPTTALSRPFSIVLTHKTAKKFYGHQNPMDDIFSIEGAGNFKVTGVLKPFPDDTHLSFDLLGSMSTLPLVMKKDSKYNPLGWSNFTMPFTYILAKPNTEINTLKQIIASVSKHASNKVERNMTFHLQPLDKITPYNKQLMGDMSPFKTRSKQSLIIMSVMAFIILLMACFNYTNLSIARALKRAREVGIYKIFGAGSFSIIAQFVTQAIIIAIISLALTYALLPIIPLPQEIMQQVFSAAPDLTLFIWLLLFVILTGLLAGGLPAWLLSRMKPIQTVKNIKSINLIKGLTVRKTLVVVQFALSLILIIVATVTYHQMKFTATADYGFQQENIILLQLEGVNHNILENEISNIVGVEGISAISNEFGTHAGFAKIQKKQSGPGINASAYSVSPDLITNLDIELLAGKTLPPDSSGTEHTILVNEQMLTAMNWGSPADAVGKTVWIDDTLQVQIAGVVENFHFESMGRSIGPLVLRYRPENFRNLFVRVATSANIDAVVNKVKNAWDKIAPKQSIEYSLYNEFIYARNMETEDLAAIGYLALIVLTIACLGLLGMVTYTVEVRTQEVGIRKVLGASVGRVILLLSKEFLLLLSLAAFIGLPVGYWLAAQNLAGFAYHISIGFGTLTFGLGIMLLVGFLAIGTQTWQIARTNPVEAIRSEP